MHSMHICTVKKFRARNIPFFATGQLFFAQSTFFIWKCGKDFALFIMEVCILQRISSSCYEFYSFLHIWFTLQKRDCSTRFFWSFFFIKQSLLNLLNMLTGAIFIFSNFSQSYYSFKMTPRCLYTGELIRNNEIGKLS